ncbi:hypothetical protein BOX15_Mlig008249g2, partial [Macrostomum lignano]
LFSKMSSMCSCFRRRASTDSIEIPRTDEIDSSDRREAASKDYQLVFLDGRNDPGRSNSYSIAKDKRAAFNQSLVSLINQRRIGRGIRPLILSPSMCRGAEAVWNDRAEVVSGLHYIPDSRFDLRYTVVPVDGQPLDKQIRLDCLVYTDNAVRSKEELPEAVFHYWTNKGSHTNAPGKGPLPLPRVNALRERCQAENRVLIANKSRFLPLLLRPSSTHIGLHFGKVKLSHGLLPKDKPYSVVAVLSNCDLN